MDIARRPHDSQEPGSNSCQRAGVGRILEWELEDDVPLLPACADAELGMSWQLAGCRLAAVLLTCCRPAAALLCCKRCADWPPLGVCDQQAGAFVLALHVCAVSLSLEGAPRAMNVSKRAALPV